MYRELLDPEANKGHPPLKALQLFHEAIVMFSGGSHPIGVILMTGFYHMLHSPEVKQRLVDEVRTAWPLLDQDPSYESLEKLPYLASVFTCRI
jgi:cytochrome P450